MIEKIGSGFGTMQIAARKLREQYNDLVAVLKIYEGLSGDVYYAVTGNIPAEIENGSRRHVVIICEPNQLSNAGAACSAGVQDRPEFWLSVWD